MATLEELQRQVEMLQQTVDALTTPPTDYYTHRWSGEEIDRGIDRAREGGALDVALSNKATNYRIISGVDLLDWALDQGMGGTYLTDLTVTGLPVQGYFNGVLTVAGQDRGLMIWDQHGNCYTRNTVSGGWSGSEWIKYAIATPPQEFDLPLVGGFTAVSEWVKNSYSKDQFGRVLVDFAVSGTINANEQTQIAILPVGYRPLWVSHSTAYRYSGQPPFVAIWVSSDGNLYCFSSETINGVAGQIVFTAH